MKYAAILLVILLTAVGCKTPVQRACTSDFDSAIENLSSTSEQLKQLGREKDFFIKILETFECQQEEFGNLLGDDEILRQKQEFVNWQRDIDLRERRLTMQHTINVFAAHNQILKRKAAEPNALPFAGNLPSRP